MTSIAGGATVMGSERLYPEKRPSRRVRVEGFWIDTAPVTNRQFTAFVEATGHRTLAEIAPDPRDYPGLLPEHAAPASLVFQKVTAPVAFIDHKQWWALVPGADWLHPTGHDSGIEALPDHPVVHIA